MDKNMNKNTNKSASKSTEKSTEKNAQGGMNRTEFAEEYSVDTNKKANCNKQSKPNN